ncbi:hypothetical protein HLH33_04910 [Gluconacetobacter diazotrophicus]|uniref:Uncharacterized protein n=1 Tax=Gluconacetobacter diazotrophicus TaxID=33996 RepID=A0A7W4FDE2_GLUDI|nr:hypothetical protein [Gluconacetobacter diazotrophicus]MBB2155653.1 hypothetical protein [Gluconacetobacter diazotrophicus]
MMTIIAAFLSSPLPVVGLSMLMVCAATLHAGCGMPAAVPVRVRRTRR